MPDLTTIKNDATAAAATKTVLQKMLEIRARASDLSEALAKDDKSLIK